jgi:hypothetical protein
LDITAEEDDDVVPVPVPTPAMPEVVTAPEPDAAPAEKIGRVAVPAAASVPDDKKPLTARIPDAKPDTTAKGEETPVAEEAPTVEETPVAEAASEGTPSPRAEERVSIDPGDATDPYEELESIFPADVREAVHDLVLRSARDADGNPIPAERLLVSGFDVDITDEVLAATDAHKLSVKSAVPEGGFTSGLGDDEEMFRHYDGDDSNQANVIERDIQELRDEKRTIARQLEAMQDAPASSKQDQVQSLGELNAKIADLQKAKASATLPIYYASEVDRLLDSRPEDNPLAYARFEEDDAAPQLAVYDRAALEAAGIVIEQKGPTQFRIHGHGADIMQHCVAIIHIDYETAADEADDPPRR